MIPWEEMRGKHEVVFTHKNHDTGEGRMWNITRLLAWIEAEPPPNSNTCTIAVEKDVADHIFRRMGIEAHRLARITAEDLARYPIILVDFEDGTSLIIDGNHRYARAYLESVKNIRAYRFSVAELEHVQIAAPPRAVEVGVAMPHSWIG